MKRMHHVGFFVFLCLLHVSIPAAFAGQAQQVKWVYSAFTGAYAPVWIAYERNLGRKYDVELELIYAGRAKPTQLLLSGETNFIFNTSTSIVEAHTHGNKDFVILASLFARPGLSIFSIPEVKSASDLQGKTVGVGRAGSITDVVGRYILKTTMGLDPKQRVKVLPLGEPGNILPALERKLIQAAVLTTPARFIAKRMGFFELVDADRVGLPYANAGMHTLREITQRDPELIRKLLKILVEAIAIYKTDAEGSLRVLRKYLRGVSEYILKETYTYFSSQAEKLPYPSVEGVSSILEMLAENNPKAKTVDANGMIMRRFVKEIEDSGFANQFYQ